MPNDEPQDQMQKQKKLHTNLYGHRQFSFIAKTKQNKTKQNKKTKKKTNKQTNKQTNKTKQNKQTNKTN